MTDRTPRNEANTLPEIQQTLAKIDTGQDALLESSLTLQHQNAVTITLLDQLVALITPKEGEQEGPRLDELLARMIAQQTMIIDLSKRTVDSVMLKDAAEMIMDHLQGRRPAAQATDVPGPIPAATPAPEAPSPPSATSPAFAPEAEPPSPPRPSPSPGM